MTTRVGVMSSTPFALLSLLLPLVLAAQEQIPKRNLNTNCGCTAQARPAEPPRDTITVWKVGSPYNGNAPDTGLSPELERAARNMALDIKIWGFSAVGFADNFFQAVQGGRGPDILAIDNYGIIEGITTPLGDFTGIASDEGVRKQLARVTESLVGLESRRAYSRPDGWEFLLTSSSHSHAAKSLALRPPECDPHWNLTPLTEDLQESAIPIARAYLEGDTTSLAAWEDPERLHTDAADPRQLNVIKINGCGYWGDERLAFLPVVATYESVKSLGQISSLLILRKQQNQWQLLAASTDPISLEEFPQAIPKLASLILDTQSVGESPFPATLLAPQDGKTPMPAPGQRFGDFVWLPSASSDVVAQIVEFAYNNDARFFLKFPSRKNPTNEQISAGALWTSNSLWKWRVWSITASGVISFSESRSFPH